MKGGWITAQVAQVHLTRVINGPFNIHVMVDEEGPGRHL